MKEHTDKEYHFISMLLNDAVLNELNYEKAALLFLSNHLCISKSQRERLYEIDSLIESRRETIRHFFNITESQ